MRRFARTHNKDLETYAPGLVLDNLFPIDASSGILLLDGKRESGQFTRVRAGDLIEVFTAGGERLGIAVWTPADLMAQGYNEVIS